ncbi:MAG: sugar phosphate isomerase/epimerase family protein [Christensenellales bacterium]|jgi:D-psicose/D-tagatose/L-ribulose 3-epimerase
MNKIGQHWGYWRGTGKETDIEVLLDVTSRVGADVLEVGPVLILGMSKQERREFRRAAQDRGLSLSFNGGPDAATDISSDDPAVRRQGIEYHRKVLSAIAEMGEDICWSGIVYSYGPRRPAKNLDHAERRRILDVSIESMKKIMPVAEDLGITYGYEIVNRFEHFLLNTTAEGVAYCEAVGSPNAKILPDVFHMNIEENNIAEAIVYAGERGRIAHMHMSESNRRVPGIGATNIDWPSVFSALKKVDYKGCITMEPFVVVNNWPSAINICVWRDLADGDIESLVRDAAKGTDFIRKMLAEAASGA